MWCLPAECALGHALDETALLKFVKSSRRSAARNLAPFESSADRKTDSTIIRPIIDPPNFDQYCAGGTTQGKIRGGVQQDAIETDMGCVAPLVSISGLRARPMPDPI